jgi:hypothetical protein
MKHLREFDDQEIQDLMGDLETVGHEQIKGWYIQTVSFGGDSIGRIFFAYNDDELEKIFGEEFRSFTEDPGYPHKVGQAWKGERTLHNNFIDAFVGYASFSEKFRYVYSIDDLKVRDVASKKSGMISFPTYNSFLVSEQLEKNFYNAKEKMTSGDFKEEFEDEMDSITI